MAPLRVVKMPIEMPVCGLPVYFEYDRQSGMNGRHAHFRPFYRYVVEEDGLDFIEITLDSLHHEARQALVIRKLAPCQIECQLVAPETDDETDDDE